MNTNLSNCTEAHCLPSSYDTPRNGSGRATDVLFCAVLPFQVVIAFTGATTNGVLCYGQVKLNNWPFYERLLFLHVTLAAMVASIAHFRQGLYQFLNYIISGNGELDASDRWSHHVGDSAQMAIVFSMVTMAFHILITTRTCLRFPDKEPGEISRKKKILISFCMVVCIWLIAAAFVTAGLNPQADFDDDHKIIESVPIISFVVHLIIQAIVAGVLWRTSTIIRQLQSDFLARGASDQQNLHTRTRIRKTIHLTSIIWKVLFLHLVTWLGSFTVAFALHETLDQSNDKVDGNKLTAYTSIAECVSLGFDLGYPFLISWQERQESILSKCFKCCKETNSSISAPSPPAFKPVSHDPTQNRLGDVSMSARVHHDAIDDHWRQVAKVRKLAV